MIEVEVVAFHAVVVTNDGFGSILFRRWFPTQVPIVTSHPVVKVETTTRREENDVEGFVSPRIGKLQHRSPCLSVQDWCFSFEDGLNDL